VGIPELLLLAVFVPIGMVAFFAFRKLLRWLRN
jgi:hypothetical protein